MSEGNNLVGISQKTFVAGLIVAIVASSLLSTLVATQLVIGPQGPKGDTGDTGPQGGQGTAGPQGELGLGVESGFLVAPAYDSGWVLSDSEWVTLNHNLGTTEVLVHLIGKDEEYGKSINHYGYGMYVMWQNLNTTHIEVYVGGYAQYVRVMLWKISGP